MKTPPDKKIAFTFMSPPANDRRECWQAVVEFPAGSGPESVLPIRVLDGDSVPVEAGVMLFAGCKLKVANGATSIRYADFVHGKHDPELWLRRKGLPDKPAYLTFA